jgi:hypothetical protein
MITTRNSCIANFQNITLGSLNIPSKFSMDKDLNLRRLNPFKTDINIVRHNFKNQSQQTDLRKHFPVETYTTTSNTMNQSLRENNT